MKKKFYFSVFVITISVTGSPENAAAGEFLINTCTQDAQTYPSVASDGVHYLVGWNSKGQDGSESGVYGQLIRKDGTRFGSEFRINTNTTMTQDAVNLSSNGNNFLAVWDSQEWGASQAYTDRVRGQLIDGNGTKIGAEIRISENVTNRDNWNYGVTSNGTDYLTTWSGIQEGSYEVYGQVVSGGDGTAIGPELHINTYTPDAQHPTGLASNGEDYLVTWISMGQDGNGYGVYARLIDGDDSVR